MSKQNLVYHYKKLNQELGFIDIDIEFVLPEIPQESPKLEEQKEKLEEYGLSPRMSKKELRGDRKMRRKSSIKISRKPVKDYQSSPQIFMHR